MLSIFSSFILDRMEKAAMFMVVLMGDWAVFDLELIQIKMPHCISALHWRVHCIKDLISNPAITISGSRRVVESIDLVNLWITVLFRSITKIVRI
jgi:hypothetical protein